MEGDSAGPGTFEDVFVYVGNSDIENDFRRVGMPAWLSDLFCLPFAFTAGEFGLHGTVLNEQMLCFHDAVSVAASNLPMGFTWSFGSAQRIF